MGGALAKGWAKAASRNEYCDIKISISARTQATLDRITSEHPTITGFLANTEAIKEADVIILAVKPWLVENVISEIKQAVNPNKQAVVSVAAGITTDKLSAMFGDESTLPPLFYAMPNIAAEYGESMTFIAAAQNASSELTNSIENLFSHVGKTKVCEERMIAPGMMMAGCGIAYVMRYLRAQMEGGVEMGFYPADALNIALQTMQGAVTLLKETGLHPEAAIDKVTTPGGTTIKGLNELDHSGFNSAVIRSLKAGLKH